MNWRDLVTLAALLAVAFMGSLTPQADVQQGREGLITHMGPGYPAEYLAIPLGPGVHVRICGPRTCLDVTSTDAGPNRASLRAGRIADVSVELFRRLCCDESRGIFEGSWTRVAPRMTLPPTSTEGDVP